MQRNYYYYFLFELAAKLSSDTKRMLCAAQGPPCGMSGKERGRGEKTKTWKQLFWKLHLSGQYLQDVWAAGLCRNVAVGPRRFIVVYSWHCHILGDILEKHLLTETSLMLSLVLKYDFLVVEMGLHQPKIVLHFALLMALVITRVSGRVIYTGFFWKTIMHGVGSRKSASWHCVGSRT